MEPPPPPPDILFLLQRQNDNLFNTLNALTGNISESFRTINLLQQENTRLNEVFRTRETRDTSGTDNRTTGVTHEHPHLEDREDPPLQIPLIDRIGGRAQVDDRVPPITFPTISSTPIIREDSMEIPLTKATPRRSGPPPPHQPPREHGQAGGSNFQGEGARRGQVSFAWSADQWRKRDRDQEVILKGVRRNEEGELDVGDLYTYSFIMRTLYGQDVRKYTPRSVKKRERRSWGMIEASFIRAVVEVVLDPELGVVSEAISTISRSEGVNPGGYLTDMITEDQEFPLDLAAALLIQNGATEQWFHHRWTTGYATSYLSEWGERNLPRQSDSRMSGTYHRVFPTIERERGNPFFLDRTTVLLDDEEVAHLPLAEALNEAAIVGDARDHATQNIPTSIPIALPQSTSDDVGIEVNVGTPDWLIW